jgi:beta-mannosidase
VRVRVPYCVHSGVEMAVTGVGEYGMSGIVGSTANGSALCYVRNDLPTAFSGSVTVEAIAFKNGATTRLSTAAVSLPAGGGAVGFFCAGNSSVLSEGKPSQPCPTFEALYRQAGCANGAADCILNVTVASRSGGRVLSQSMLPLGLPSALNLPAAKITASVQPAASGSASVGITLSSNATSLWVWLSTIEQGRFSDNAFVLLPGVEKKVEFLSFVEAGTSATALEASLRVEHLGMYLP